MPATIADVAARADVSIATVSRVLTGSPGASPRTRDQVMAAVRELGYHPSAVAQSLKQRRTHTLGLIITDIGNPYFPALVRAVEDAAHAAGYAVLLCNGDEDPEREADYVELLASRRVDGLIVAASTLTDRHGGWLASTTLPTVLVNCADDTGWLAAILSDNYQGGWLAAEHLIGLGHRRLGIITGPARHSAAGERQAGMTAAIRALAAGASMAAEEGDGHVEGGERAADRLLQTAPDVSGVVCYNDLTAIGAMRALRATGRDVPGDVSVVGFDDIDVAPYTDPPLTTIAQETGSMGRWAVASLLARIPPAGPPEAATRALTVRLPVHLVVRESTMAAVRPAEAR